MTEYDPKPRDRSIFPFYINKLRKLTPAPNRNDSEHEFNLEE